VWTVYVKTYQIDYEDKTGIGVDPSVARRLAGA